MITLKIRLFKAVDLLGRNCLTFQRKDGSKMGHMTEDQEKLALEGFLLLMHIAAESTIITFKIKILRINVKKS